MGQRIMTEVEFVHLLAGDRDRRYALFIGAGCSASSGIPATRALVNLWLLKLRKDQGEESTPFAEWVRDKFPGYRQDDPADSFADVMQEYCRPNSDEIRRQEVERLCDGRFPSFGYGVLARLVVAQPRFNVLLTTNFDDLIADALYLFTDTHPLVIGHESLADFIRVSQSRPLVVKLHGDHQLAPKVTGAQTTPLQAKLEEQVQRLLSDRGLIFIGYGGGDESIAKILHSLPDTAVPEGIFWVSREGPRIRVATELKRRPTCYVTISDFDDLMLKIMHHFSLRHANPHSFRRRALRKYMDTYEVLERRGVAESITPGSDDDDPFSATVQELPASDWAAVLRAGIASRKNRSAYDEPIRNYPSSSPLLVAYAQYLIQESKSEEDYDAAESHLRKAMAADPSCPESQLTLASLSARRNRRDEALKLLESALEANPGDATFLARCARCLEDLDEPAKARNLYEEALSKDRYSAAALWYFARFLAAQRDFKYADTCFAQAAELDRSDAANLISYARFLADVTQDLASAERYYEDAVELRPADVATLTAYATFLLKVRPDDPRIGDLLTKALAVEPEAAEMLETCRLVLEVDSDSIEGRTWYDGALLGRLAEIAKDLTVAERYYGDAVELRPADVATLTTYATFLLKVRPDDPRIGDLLTKALAVEPEAAEMLEEVCRLAYEVDQASLGKRTWYACALLWHGDLGLGLEVLSPLLYHSDLPDIPELQAEVWFCALVYLPEREEEACESLRRAINCGAVIRHQRLQAHLRHLEVPAPRVQYLEGVEKVLMSSASSEVRLNDPIWSRRPEKSSEAAALS